MMHCCQNVEMLGYYPTVYLPIQPQSQLTSLLISLCQESLVRLQFLYLKVLIAFGQFSLNTFDYAEKRIIPIKYQINFFRQRYQCHPNRHERLQVMLKLFNFLQIKTIEFYFSPHSTIYSCTCIYYSHGHTMRTIKVQCFPIYSVLKAIGNPRIDYFSLDIEGAELQVTYNILMGDMIHSSKQ